MRHENITGLLCLSCVLLFLCINYSQSSCQTGWFGARCKYKCRCINDRCDTNGVCTGFYKCLGGWFGPACQYADLAYLRAPSPEVTDGNDSTCKPTRSITIPLNDTHFFTWMRVLISDKAPAELDKLALTFSANKTQVKCANLKTHVVDKRTVDLHCNLTKEIDELTLHAQAVSGLCSVYVSGGRNVALKEKAYQDSFYFEEVKGHNHTFPAELAVDGGRSQNMYELSCAVTNFTPTWTLSFSMPRRVHSYVIYNRVDKGAVRLKGFRLQSFDYGNNAVFEYNEPNITLQETYRIIHRPTSIEKIKITVFNQENLLQLCEVEVYGDSDCEHHHYGRDCELSCNCLPLEACFASSGGCPSGCPIGYYGDGCMIICSFGRFGKYCNKSCSVNCVSSTKMTYCNVSTGACLLGCKSGFGGVFCQDVCPVGKFGAKCSSSCSPNCMPPGVKDVSPCDPVNGSCRKGCKNGFIGSPCLEECPVGKYGAKCSSSCSQNCIPSGEEHVSPCDPVTGICRKGCKDGFTGSHCLEKCPVGKFGAKCNSLCSPNCMPTGAKDVSPCDPVTGKCTKGCKEGFSGSPCVKDPQKSVAAEKASSDMDVLPITIGMCLLIAALAFFGYLFCKKRRAPTSAEREAASVHPDLLK